MFFDARQDGGIIFFIRPRLRHFTQLRTLTFVTPTWHLAKKLAETFVGDISMTLLTKFGCIGYKRLGGVAFLKIFRKCPFLTPTWLLAKQFSARFVVNMSINLLTNFGKYTTKRLDVVAFLMKRLEKKKKKRISTNTIPDSQRLLR